MEIDKGKAEVCDRSSSIAPKGRNSPRKSRNTKLRRKLAKENSVSSMSVRSNKAKNTGGKNKKTNSTHKEKSAKVSTELQQIALIRTKLENVLKEKFTSVDLVAKENANKIFDDLKYLSGADIQINSL